jgi:hypothetical protein
VAHVDCFAVKGWWTFAFRAVTVPFMASHVGSSTARRRTAPLNPGHDDQRARTMVPTLRRRKCASTGGHPPSLVASDTREPSIVTESVPVEADVEEIGGCPSAWTVK